jgi:hypothetical protein
MNTHQFEFPFAIEHGRSCAILRARERADRKFALLHARVEDEMARLGWFNDFTNVVAIAADALDPDDEWWRPSYLRESGYSMLEAVGPDYDGTLAFDSNEIELAKDMAAELLDLAKAVAAVVNQERFAYDMWRIAA